MHTNSPHRSPAQGRVVAILAVVLLLSAVPVGQARGDAIKIMPLGDSLTNGTGTESGYRAKLYNDLVTAGYDIDFVGSLSTNPSPGLPDPHHEGHPGFNIDNIANGWSSYPGIDTWLNPAVCDPDIILLMIGSNDVSEQRDFANVGARFDDLVTRISGAGGLQPDAHMIIALVPPRGDKPYDYNTQFLNGEIARVAGEHMDLGENISLVDMYSPLSPADLIDGVHCNQTGYNKISDIWFAGIEAIPEPVSLAMMGLGGAAMLVWRRRK